MIGGMVRNFILKEANVVLKMYKILIRPPLEYLLRFVLQC